MQSQTVSAVAATPSSSISGANVSARQAPVDHRRLHDLPLFDGKPEDWPLFHNSFVDTTEAFGYTKLENQLRLQKALSGAAKTSVQQILIHSRHVGQVMQTLQNNFGGPEILLWNQLQASRELPNVTEDHLEDLGHFSTGVQNLATFLDTNETQQYLAKTRLYSMSLLGSYP